MQDRHDAIERVGSTIIEVHPQSSHDTKTEEHIHHENDHEKKSKKISKGKERFPQCEDGRIDHFP